MLLFLLHRRSTLPCPSCSGGDGGWALPILWPQGRTVGSSQPETPTLQWVPGKRAVPYPGTRQAPPAPHNGAPTAKLRPTHLPEQFLKHLKFSPLDNEKERTAEK